MNPSPVTLTLEDNHIFTIATHRAARPSRAAESSSRAVRRGPVPPWGARGSFRSSAQLGRVARAIADRPSATQALVHRPEPAGERRVHRRPERDRLAVHRSSGRDDEIGERDEAERIHGALRDDERRRGSALAARPLGRRARQDDSLHVRRRSRAAEARSRRPRCRRGGRARPPAACGRLRARASGRSPSSSRTDGSGRKPWR